MDAPKAWLLSGVSAVVGLMIHVTASAAEWSVTPVVQSAVDYYSNRQLGDRATPGDEFLLQAEVTARRATASMSLLMHARAAVQRFTANSASDANNGGADVAWSLQHERSTYATQFSWARDNTLSTQLSDLGLFAPGTVREQRIGSASWSYVLDEATLLSVVGGSQGTDYTIRQFVMQSYAYPNVNVSLKRNVTELSVVGLTLSAAQLNNHLDGSVARDKSAQLTYERPLSARTTLSARVGYSTERGPTRSGGDYLAGLTLSRHSTLVSWNVDLARINTPDGNGRLVQRDTLGLSATRQLTEKLLGFANLQALRDSDLKLTPLFVAPGRKQNFAEVGLRWEVGTTWSLDVRAITQRVELSPGHHNTSTGSSLNLIWKPLPLAVSR